jgi:DNA-binding NtrC family response regulator
MDAKAAVLVVDDDDGVRETTAAILRHEGFDVLEASDGAAATWTLANEHVDVVLLDLRLRRVDGTVVLEALEESSTVVIVSAFEYFEESDIRQRFGTVVFEFLQKPVLPRRLVDVTAAAATHARSRGLEPKVRPIAPRMALGLAMSGLARMTPETECSQQACVEESRPDLHP